MCPEAIAIAVGTLVTEYDIESEKKDMLYSHVMYNILQDHQDAIDHLKAVGYLK